jgi:iron-sulfur cluster assembly protein
MAVHLSEATAEHVRRMPGRRGSGLGLRRGVRRSGCSGFAYTIDYADEIGEQDRAFVSHGINLVVDRESLPASDGTEIDFVRENMLNRGFELRNPRKDTCGCGESFRV